MAQWPPNQKLKQWSSLFPRGRDLKTQLRLGAVRHGFKLVEKLGSRVEAQRQRQQTPLYSALSSEIENIPR